MRTRHARTLIETLVIIVCCGAAIAAVGYYGPHQDWKFLRDWGILSQKRPKLPKLEYFEPMGIPSRLVMMGFDKVFKLEEVPLDSVEKQQPLYLARDDETLAMLEIRGEKENIGLAKLTVWMPRIGLTPNQYHTEQTVAYNLMNRFIGNTMPGTLPSVWLKELVTDYKKGGDIAVEKVDSGMKLLIRKDPRMRDMIHVIVMKDQ